jgi:hypothetical protein
LYIRNRRGSADLEPTAGAEGSANRLREREADALRKPLARHESPGSFG